MSNSSIGQDKIELKKGRTVYTYNKTYAKRLEKESWVEVILLDKDINGSYRLEPKKDLDGNLIWKINSY